MSKNSSESYGKARKGVLRMARVNWSGITLFLSMHKFTDQNQHTAHNKGENKGCHTVKNRDRTGFMHTNQYSKKVRHD